MEKLTERFQSCEAALTLLAEALSLNPALKKKRALPFNVIVRDAAMQRFEYSFEATWKLLKHYLDRREGVVCSSPKSCFREALPAGLLSAAETEVCLTMVDDRNLTAHTYHESLAATIYARLPGYLNVMRALTARLAERLPLLQVDEHLSIRVSDGEFEATTHGHPLAE